MNREKFGNASMRNEKLKKVTKNLKFNAKTLFNYFSNIFPLNFTNSAQTVNKMHKNFHFHAWPVASFPSIL